MGLVVLMMSGYQSTRILVWQDPWAYPRDGGYQIIQSLYAIGSGGLLGLGLGKSRQKFLYLPEPENDFIFAIVCEELGLIGAGIVLILFALLVMRGYWIAIHARDRFGALLVVGITTLTAVQVFLNISVVTNLIPTTGISPAVFQLRGYGADDPTGGDGHHPFRFPADPGAETGVKGPGRTLFPCAARDSGVLRRRMSCCAHPLNFFHPMAGEAF